MSTFEEYAKSWSIKKKYTHQHLVRFCCWFHFKTFYGYYSGNCEFSSWNCVFDSLMFENFVVHSFPLKTLKNFATCNSVCILENKKKNTWRIPSSIAAKVFQPTQLCKCIFFRSLFIIMNAKYIDTSLIMRKYYILPRQWPLVLVRSESSDHKLFWSVEYKYMAL